MTAKSVDAGPKVAADVKATMTAKSVDAGPKAAVSAVTTTSAKSVAGVVDAGAVADVKAMTTTKNADAGRKAVANAATITNAKNAADPKVVAGPMAVSVAVPKVTVAELAKSAKAGGDPRAAVVKTVNVERAVEARASIAKRS